MSIKKIVFEGTSWIRNNWYITSFPNTAYIFDYNPSNNQMKIATPDIRTNVVFYSSSPVITAVAVDYLNETWSFRKIECCPEHPECEGKWIPSRSAVLLDSKRSGGVTALYRLYSRLHCLFRKAVSL